MYHINPITKTSNFVISIYTCVPVISNSKICKTYYLSKVHFPLERNKSWFAFEITLPIKDAINGIQIYQIYQTI